MKLDNHIVNRLLTDENLWTEMIISQAEKDGIHIDRLAAGEVENYLSMYGMINNKDNKTYYVTKSVTDKLSMLGYQKMYVCGRLEDISPPAGL